jgi:hypothetical protein
MAHAIFFPQIGTVVRYYAELQQNRTTLVISAR